jgi:hypothetical protein
VSFLLYIKFENVYITNKKVLVVLGSLVKYNNNNNNNNNNNKIIKFANVEKEKFIIIFQATTFPIKWLHDIVLLLSKLL